MTSACVSYERTLPDAAARTAPHHLVINPVATERCREVCASSTRLDQVTTWQAADRYRNNEGPAVAREALAQLAIFYISGVTGATDGSFGWRPARRKTGSSALSLCSTHLAAHTRNSALELTCSLCLMFSRWLSIVFTLKPNDCAICRVPSPEPSNWKMCISRLDNSSREGAGLSA